MGVLNRYLCKKYLLALCSILSATVAIVIFFDVLLNVDKLLSSPVHSGYSRWNLIAQLYLMRIPAIIVSVLPFTVMGAALVTCAPMLRKNEFTALGASGLSPQHICRVLFWIALGCGIMQYSISNHINPRVYNHNSYVETALGRPGNTSRNWKCSDNGSIWFATDSRIFDDRAPSFSQVFIVANNGDIIFAPTMSWHEKQWQLHPPIVHWDTHNEHGQQTVHNKLSHFALEGPFALNLTPYDIQQKLLTREALTGGDLFASGEHMHLSLFLNRCLTLFAPLLALCYGLPYFARFAHRQQILIASAKALTLASIPVLIIALTGMAADASSWSPWLSNGLGFALAAIPGYILYTRWHY